MKFSIIIPVAPYRDAEILNSLKDLDFPKKKYEIIVEKGTNASENRNRGFEKSKGKIIVFLDDDAVADKELLKNAEKFFKEHPEIDIIGGPQLTPPDEKGFAKISGYALSSKFGGWNASNRYGKKKLNLNADDTYLTSAIMFCKREVMNKIKFDKNLWPGEDSKFVIDAKKLGMKIAYCPDLIIYHRRRPTAKALIKQIYNYGKDLAQRESFFETIKRPFFLAPGIFFVYLLLLPFILLIMQLIFENWKIDLIILFPLILYLFLDFIFSVYEGIKNKDFFSIFLLFFIFPIIHLSHGAGWFCNYLKIDRTKTN